MEGGELRVQGWIGMLGPLGETEGGDVFITVHLRGFGRPELEHIARLVTMAHPLADEGLGTMIRKDTGLYQKLHTFKREAMVRVSGHFVEGETDAIRLLNDFSAMQRVYALFRFTDVEPLK